MKGKREKQKTTTMTTAESVESVESFYVFPTVTFSSIFLPIVLFFSSSSFPVFLRDNPFHTSIYNIDKSVLVENRPLVKLIRNYIRDLSGVFSISSLVRISMTSFPAFTLFFVQKLSCLYNKKKITRWLEDMNFIFSW